VGGEQQQQQQNHHHHHHHRWLHLHCQPHQSPPPPA
jgi:hypothetical protein